MGMPPNAYAWAMFWAAAQFRFSEALANHPAEYVCVCWGRGGVSFFSLGAVWSWFLPCSGCRVGGSQGEAERSSLPGVTGWEAPQGRTSPWQPSMGTLFPGASWSRIRKWDMPRWQKEPWVVVGPHPLTQRHQVYRSLTHTNVTGVCVCVYGGEPWNN